MADLPTEELAYYAYALTSCHYPASVVSGGWHQKVDDVCSRKIAELQGEIRDRLENGNESDVLAHASAIIDGTAELYGGNKEWTNPTSLAQLSDTELIELHSMSKYWYNMRRAKGMEVFTRSYQWRIVNELIRRKAHGVLARILQLAEFLETDNYAHNIGMTYTIGQGVKSFVPSHYASDEELRSYISSLSGKEEYGLREELIQIADYIQTEIVEKGLTFRHLKPVNAILCTGMPYFDYPKIARAFDINPMASEFDIPSAVSIDYTNADEICGYQMLLCKMYERAGGFKLPQTSNKVTLVIRREGLTWLRKVKASIGSIFNGSSSLNLGDIPTLIDSYDFFYRVCHGTPDFDFIRQVRINAADRYAKGDKSISASQLALMLNKEISRDIRNIDKRYLSFAGSVKTEWIRDLEKYGRLSGMPMKEAYEVLKYLLYENLSVYLSDPNAKSKWIASYMIDDEGLDILDSDTLWAYLGFEQAAGYVMGRSLDEQDSLYTYLLKKLCDKADVHPFMKECILLDLAKRIAA